jgi:hypothetical protein
MIQTQQPDRLLRVRRLTSGRPTGLIQRDEEVITATAVDHTGTQAFKAHCIGREKHTGRIHE